MKVVGQFLIISVVTDDTVQPDCLG